MMSIPHNEMNARHSLATKSASSTTIQAKHNTTFNRNRSLLASLYSLYVYNPAVGVDRCRKKSCKKRGSIGRIQRSLTKPPARSGGAIDNLQSQLNVLRAEIRADKDGLFDFNNRLAFLYKEREMLETRNAQNKAWAEKFDEKIGPFEKMYDALTDGMTSLYDNAKTEHKKGIDVLIREFNYHPLWKQGNGCFTATPFKPE